MIQNFLSYFQEKTGWGSGLLSGIMKKKIMQLVPVTCFHYYQQESGYFKGKKNWSSGKESVKSEKKSNIGAIKYGAITKVLIERTRNPFMPLQEQ